MINKHQKEEPNPEFLDEGYYVYALIDPRNSEIFYIGKGQGLRAAQHEEEVRRILDDHDENLEINNRKQQRIMEIHKANKQVKIYLLRHGLNATIFRNRNGNNRQKHEEVVALELEAMAIDFIKMIQQSNLKIATLTNEQEGHHTNERGFISFEDFRNNIADIKETDGFVIACNVKSKYPRCNYDAYQAVKEAWEINEQKRNRVRYILAVYNSVVVGVFIPKEWYFVKTVKGRRNRHLYGFEKIEINTLSAKEQKIYNDFKERVLGKHFAFAQRQIRKYINTNK